MLARRKLRAAATSLAVFILLGAVGLAAAPAAKAPKSTLAILDLRPGEGVPNSVAVILSDLIRTGMVKSQLFEVIDRNSMASILKEQAFQKSGCTETACAVQIGRLLAAEKLLVGTVNRAGKKFIINGNIVDVGKGRIDFAEFGAIEDISKIEQGAEEYARRIAARIAGVSEDSLIGRKPRWPYVWRSALLPGWGQRHEGARWTGNFYTLAAVAALGNWGSAYRSAVAARKDYQNTIGLPQLLVGGDTTLVNFALFSQARANFEDKRSAALAAGNLLAAVWVLNVIDSFFEAGTAERFFGFRGLAPDVRIAIGVAPPMGTEKRAQAFAAISVPVELW